MHSFVLRAPAQSSVNRGMDNVSTSARNMHRAFNRDGRLSVVGGWLLREHFKPAQLVSSQSKVENGEIFAQVGDVTRVDAKGAALLGNPACAAKKGGNRWVSVP